MFRYTGIITEGGVKTNIIPERAQLQYCLRAPNIEELWDLTKMVLGCIKGAACATGCVVGCVGG